MFLVWKPGKRQSLSNTVSPHAVFNIASRERTGSVRRRHGELGVLIKIFYKSACAVHMRDNGLEWGGVWWILKQLPLWNKPQS